MIPGLTTVQRTYGTSPGEDPERIPLDLYVGIDCSGSMVNPRLAVSWPVLAGCVIALSALRAGARVMAVLSGHPGPHSATAGFVDNEREVLRILTGYLGSGYAFGIPLLAETFAARRPTGRPVHILIVSDHDIFAMLDEKTGGRTGWTIAREALVAARGGGTFALHMPPHWDRGNGGCHARAGVAGSRHPGVGGHRALCTRVQPPRLGGRGRGGRRVRHEGPPLEQLLRRLAECPPDFLPDRRLRERISRSRSRPSRATSCATSGAGAPTRAASKASGGCSARVRTRSCTTRPASCSWPAGSCTTRGSCGSGASRMTRSPSWSGASPGSRPSCRPSVSSTTRTGARS